MVTMNYKLYHYFSLTMANKTSQHILGTSANLLGFCLFVLTSLHISNYSVKSWIDECTSFVSILLVFSCLFSFFSIRTGNEKKEKWLESAADLLFGMALVGLLAIVLLLALKFIK
jgi:hypothetical protein